MIYPEITPKFTLDRGMKIFTIGSCFARNIEEKLVGFDLPTTRYRVPPEEFPHRPNGVLNEYTAGTIHDRIVSVLDPSLDHSFSIIPAKDGYIDLNLPAAIVPTTYARALERQEEIKDLYLEMKTSDAVIITLGLTECWLDTKANRYFKHMPPASKDLDSSRYSFVNLEYAEAYSLLDSAMRAIIDGIGIKKIILTVSPVPLASSFSGYDAVVANGYSKALLRVCAQMLYQKYDEVDYFPSYEMVVSCSSAYAVDNVHVKDNVVGLVTDYMTANYVTDSD
ncbi:hypothetical protein BV911_18510 [Pseudoruegeria sp. SK021]|nr:hypothetical protein BV911_18510 [Pseudoruegeria sp. SK021]